MYVPTMYANGPDSDAPFKQNKQRLIKEITCSFTNRKSDSDSLYLYEWTALQSGRTWIDLPLSLFLVVSLEM